MVTCHRRRRAVKGLYQIGWCYVFLCCCTDTTGRAGRWQTDTLNTKTGRYASRQTNKKALRKTDMQKKETEEEPRPNHIRVRRSMAIREKYLKTKHE